MNLVWRWKVGRCTDGRPKQMYSVGGELDTRKKLTSSFESSFVFVFSNQEFG